MWLTKIGLAGPVVRWIYIIILGFLSIYIFIEYFNARKKEKETGIEATDVVGTKLSDYIQKDLAIPPVIHCKMSGITISIWAIIFVGCLTGLVAGLLGVGGGFLRVPALLYFIGTPTKVAVGTDLFEVMLSGAYGAFSYAASGVVELKAAIVMLLGAAVGAQFGTVTTKYVYGLFIRLLFAITVGLAAISVALRQVGYYFEITYIKLVETHLEGLEIAKTAWTAIMQNKEQMYTILVQDLARPDLYDKFTTFWTLNKVSQYMMLGSALGLSIYILFLCFRGMAKERREKLALETSKTSDPPVSN